VRRLAASLALVAATVVSTVVLPATAAAERIDEIFERGNEAYYEGNTRHAIRQYERLVEAGVHDPDLYYNLATAYARDKRWGYAILYFERTLALRPGDEGAERGLKAARETLARRRAQTEGEAEVTTSRPFGETVVRPLSENTLAWLLLALDLGLFGVLVARRYTRGESARLALGIAAPLTAVALVLAGAGLTIKTGALERGEPAIVLEENVVVREGPDPRAARRAEAREGERARVIERYDGFVRVRLPGGREGWMSSSKVGTIRPA